MNIANETARGRGAALRSGIIRRRGRTAGLALLLALPMHATPQDASEADVAADVSGARDALARWVEARQLISKETRDWALGRELLVERADLVRREIEALRERIRAAEASLAEIEGKHAELQAESDTLKEASAGLAERIGPLEERTRALLAQLPDPLRERVKPVSQRLPEPDADAATSANKASLSERYLNVMGILNEADRFQREISVTTEVRELADGTRAEVSVLYLGIGQAFYTNARGDAAGFGSGGPSGWTWTPRADAAESIAAALAVQNGDREPTFVPLPLVIE